MIDIRVLSTQDIFLKIKLCKPRRSQVVVHVDLYYECQTIKIFQKQQSIGTKKGKKEIGFKKAKTMQNDLTSKAKL